MENDYIIVGCGLYGVVTARVLTNRGYKCLIIDKRAHIGGTCYSERIGMVDIHKYGPHIFHTSNKKVINFVSRYSKFDTFQLNIIADNGRKYYHLPFNMNTFLEFFGVKTPSDAKAVIDMEIKSSGIDPMNPKNLEEKAISLVGTTIYKELIKEYTEKQWGRPCNELPAWIINRLPLRFSFDNNYFNDTFQGVPSLGYEVLFRNIIKGNKEEKEIEVVLNEDFLQNKERWLNKGSHIIYCGSIDELFDYKLGTLEWRSLEFKETEYQFNGYNGQGCPLINKTFTEEKATRFIDHIYFNREAVDNYRGTTILTKEYPCRWERGKERYYPINDEKNNNLYKEYFKLLKKEYSQISMGGRIGLYKYLDMDKTIIEALKYEYEIT